MGEGEMYFYLPTKIYSERDCVKNRADEWTALGRNALIVTGRSSAKNGSLEDVENALKGRGITYCIYNDIEENPSIETVMKARDFGLEKQVRLTDGCRESNRADDRAEGAGSGLSLSERI